MSKQIRNLGIFLMVCYVALFAQLHRFAVVEADDLKEDPRNRRELFRDFGAPRGTITTQDGVLLAESIPIDTQYELQREYPEGELFGHITGYYGRIAGHIASSGLEAEYDSQLRGDLGIQLDPGSIIDHFLDDERVGNLTLTMRHDVQQRAQELFDGQAGSAVVLDPRTGAIIAMYSNPTYDPNELATHDFDAALQLYEELNDAEQRPERPLLGRSYQGRFFPGSTFKVVTAAAGLASGGVTTDAPVYPSDTCYEPPDSSRCVFNYGNNACGGALFEILARSCNTSFMQMAVDEIGADLMVDTAEGFGFNADVPIDLPDAAESFFPQPDSFQNARAFLALSAIGQFEVQATPLEMALIAAAVANEGNVPTPHVVSEIRDNEERRVERNEPGTWQRAMDESDAAVLYDAMVNVVQDGTAGNLQLDGYVTGGKTGTAQLDDSRTRSHAWIIGFAGPEGEVPTVAAAVLVEAQDGASEQTGGSVAAPIAADLMAMALAPPAQSE